MQVVDARGHPQNTDPMQGVPKIQFAPSLIFSFFLREESCRMGCGGVVDVVDVDVLDYSLK
jgi:hypothetical protein